MSSASQSPNTANCASHQSAEVSSIEVDITSLSVILQHSVAAPSDETDVAELLRQIEAADGIAQGVEARLDGIIDHLDALLNDLEPEVVMLPESTDAASGLKVQESNAAGSEQQT